MNERWRSNTERLRDALEDDIVNGRLRPGERFDPEALERRFGVSRTPVRDAIHQLAASGLVTVVPKRGTFVAELGIERLIEMFEVMAELEGMCGRLAARRMDDHGSAELLAALERCRDAERAGDPDAYYYDNERFHQCIYAAARNAFLAEQAQHLHDRLKPYRRLQLRVRHRTTRSLEEHERIVEAILAGEESRAETLLRAHIVIQGERFSDLVASIGRFHEADRPATRAEA